jgi:hypothetical protein
MASFDERIEQQQKKLEQLKRQKKAKQQREAQKSRAIDTRRKIIAGAIVLDIFPKFATLQPKRNNEENNTEFEFFANFFKCLVDKKDWVAQLEREAQARKKPHVPPNDNREDTGLSES